MSELYYKTAMHLSRRLGMWVFHFLSWFVTAGFFLFKPRRVMISVRFYQRLFPGKRAPYYLWCTWRQYRNFTTVFLDRAVFAESGHIDYSSEGWDHLEQALNCQTGGIILMSHLGNWEIAAHLLKQQKEDLPLLLYMGSKQKEQIERLQKESLVNSGVRIIAVDRENASPFDIIEGVRFLQAGGFVSVTGDILWHQQQRRIPVHFLGRDVYFPETPHLLALLSGAPIYVFFAFRTGPRQYHFSSSEPHYVKADSRAKRDPAVKASAQHYACLLEQTVYQHPLQWYHFSSDLTPQDEKQF
ncbi:lysophospholipid acyltransferase family protein [Desulfococcaceae bacterium HSG9]|nr:lysophospholipid acyltransferase family protein [Desulfococcaceae bacterium HSG9]